MMGSPSELSLDCRTHSYSMLLKSFGDHNNNNNQTDQATQKLEEYLNRLEEERLKIDAFKRELPLCMQLLSNAMEASRQQLQSYRANNNEGSRPVVEEFIPLKHPNLEGADQKAATTTAAANISDKANWMVSAQLWSQGGDTNKNQASTTTLPKSEVDTCFSISSPKLALDTNQRNGGAFLPFARDQNSIPTNSNIRALPDLALASSDRDNLEDKKCVESENGVSGGSRSENSSRGNVVTGKTSDSQAPTTPTSATTTTNQTHRKARRCWSPDLHRRFVNALQMLGGSQVATPKQIRELMKVDGLTNDEVKSHLQKYRLHTRRPSPSPQTVGGQAPQLVVLGGIWVPPEYASAAAAAHGGAPTIYSTHPSTQVSSHYCSSPTVPSDFYPQPSQAHSQPLHHPSLHHHHHHNNHHHQQQQQLHIYKTGSHTQTQSSPESDAHQGAGDRSESIEDRKSDSSSWKGGGKSGENNNNNNNEEERKKIAALRDDGEESNGSEITLKF